MGHELCAGDAFEETVADFIEGIGVLNGGGDVAVVAEAVQYVEKRSRWYVGVGSDEIFCRYEEIFRPVVVDVGCCEGFSDETWRVEFECVA